MKRQKHILLVGSKRFTKSTALLFRPRADFRITYAASVSIGLLLHKWRPDIAVVNCDDLQYQVVNAIDALKRFETKPAIIVVSSSPVSQVVTSAAQAVLHPSDLRNSLSQLVALHFQSSSLKRSIPLPGVEVPLGVVDENVKLGAHIAYLWETEKEFREIAGFWTVGTKPDAFLFLVAPHDASAKFLEALKVAGLNPSQLAEKGRLALLVTDIVDEHFDEEVQSRILAAAVHEGTVVRAVGFNAGGIQFVGHPQIASFERRLTNLLLRLPVVMLCPYRISEFTAPMLMERALRTHPLVIYKNKLHRNPFWTI
jgi:hypothetical protein